ncbi:hypothetical protein DR950_10605 [Kitasatospora xanthocidica]|uniref:DUF1877 family protein n=1 Tax=Kitasatospora xanthocidica TaxID=83382 RepID=A0A372ZR06_9ACTN|nr:hypothetical protein [Kitasatospora xanthocidica]RGD58181.1 hypothetical protein DR950_10605 [Kitasatospora xanthocidica]
MSVDFFWRRVDGTVLDELSPTELRALVPGWSDDDFGPLYAAGAVLAVERNGYLMHVALMKAVGGAGPDLRAAQLPVFGGEERTAVEGDPDCDAEFGEMAVWVLRPDEVRTASAFLDAVGVDELVGTVDAVLADEVASLGFATPWSEAWAGDLSADLRALKDYFAQAAAAGDAMVKVEAA